MFSLGCPECQAEGDHTFQCSRRAGSGASKATEQREGQAQEAARLRAIGARVDRAVANHVIRERTAAMGTRNEVDRAPGVHDAGHGGATGEAKVAERALDALTVTIENALGDGRPNQPGIITKNTRNYVLLRKSLESGKWYAQDEHGQTITHGHETAAQAAEAATRDKWEPRKHG